MRSIFYEVDIQNDFMNEDNGRLYVPGAEDIKPNIARLVSLAKQNGIQRVRSRDRHFADDPELENNGGPFPWHCMDRSYNQMNSDGSYGIDFIAQTGPEEGFVVTNKVQTGSTSTPTTRAIDEAVNYGQQNVILEKQHYDVFTNPQAEWAIKATGAQRAIVYGVATDFCVKAAVPGLQQQGIQTYVVTDAISAITPQGEAEALDEMTQAGAKLVTLDQVVDMVGGWQ